MSSLTSTTYCMS